MADIIDTPKHPRFIDRTGQSFGRWTVLGYAGKRKGSHLWRCRCSCGHEGVAFGSNLASGISTSCGCYRREYVSKCKRVHGASNGGGIRAPGDGYLVWSDMRRRCLNPTNSRYENYGGRGIKVCDRWLHGDGGVSAFECFMADMGPRPSLKHSIDRINNDGNYEPSNCRWATPTEQARNKRDNRTVEFRGRKMVMQEAIKESGIPEWTVYQRLKAGWSVDRALNQPVLARKWRGPKTRMSE